MGLYRVNHRGNDKCRPEWSRSRQTQEWRGAENVVGYLRDMIMDNIEMHRRGSVGRGCIGL
jgi:hypothetical protein